MEFGYARILEHQQQDNPMLQQLLKCVADDRFIFRDIRNQDYERKNYKFMRNLLRSGDVLYIDGLDSLGHDFEAIAAEWQYLTKECGVDVIVLESNGEIDSRKFGTMGQIGEQLEAQMLYLLNYMGTLQHREDTELKAAQKVGRPALDWDWDLFDATAQRWADDEISLEEACAIMNSARSSWYKYAKERGFIRNGKRKTSE